MSWKNRLYFGNNLTILLGRNESESVALVSLDPEWKAVLYGE
jgi:hypothetical protein